MSHNFGFSFHWKVFNISFHFYSIWTRCWKRFHFNNFDKALKREDKTSLACKAGYDCVWRLLHTTDFKIRFSFFATKNMAWSQYYCSLKLNEIMWILNLMRLIFLKSIKRRFWRFLFRIYFQKLEFKSYKIAKLDSKMGGGNAP